MAIGGVLVWWDIIEMLETIDQFDKKLDPVRDSINELQNELDKDCDKDGKRK